MSRQTLSQSIFKSTRAALCAVLLMCVASMTRAEELALPGASASAAINLESAIGMALQNQPKIAGLRASVRGAVTQQQSANSPLAMISGPQIHIRRQQAELGVALAQAGVDAAELEAINAVTRSYLTVVYAKAQVKVATDSVSRFDAIYEIAKGFVESGTSDLTTADVEKIATYRLLAKSKLVQAQSGIARATALLREAIGLPCNYPLEVSDDTLWHEPVRINCHCAVELALKYRPSVLQAHLAAQITCLEVAAQKLTLHMYAKTFAATADIHAKVLPATVINGEYRPGPLGPEMPVYLAGSRSARVERAGHLYDRAVAVAQKARGLVALEAEETCHRLHEFAEQVIVLREAHAKAEKLARDSERGFRADQVSAEDMLTAQVIESQTHAQLNDALYQYGIALASLHRVTGGRFWDCVEK